MKSNFIHIHSTQQFKKIALYTLIVYFITSFCGWFNFALAKIFDKLYFPLRSYLIIFDKDLVTNISEKAKNIYNLTGYKAIINTSIPYKLIDDLFFIMISVLLVTLFFIGYKIIQSNKINQQEIIKWSILFSILMAFSIPSHSSDLSGYIARGAQQTLYNQNPYIETVSTIKGHKTHEMFFNFMWPQQPTTYGPIFICITKSIVFLSNNNFFTSIINFKFLNLMLFFLLILFTLRTNDTKNIYLISWNPLILIQGLWNCHNDLISGTLIFFGLYLILKEQYFWSIFCLTCGAGIKYISLLLIPIIIFYILKAKPSRAVFLNIVLGICSGVILVTILSMDYLIPKQGMELSNINKIIISVNLIHKSLIATIYTIVKYYSHWQKLNLDLITFQAVLKLIFYSLFGLFYLLILIKRKTNLVYDICLVLFILLGFTIAKFHSWYLLNLIVLLPLIPNSTLKNMFIALSMSHTFAITFLDQAKILNFISMTLLPTMFVLFKKRNKK